MLTGVLADFCERRGNVLGGGGERCLQDDGGDSDGLDLSVANDDGGGIFSLVGIRGGRHSVRARVRSQAARDAMGAG